MLKWPPAREPEESEYQYFEKIHFWAQQMFQWKSDQEAWGVPEYWPSLIDIESNVEFNKGILVGDCDDFAQLVRYFLAKEKYLTRIVTCFTENGGAHAVAEIESGYVFDQRQPRITDWKFLLAIGYKKDRMGPLCDPNDPYLKGNSDWHEAL